MPAIPFDGNIDLQNASKVINVPAPTAAGDAASKSYVDAVAQGVIFKQEVTAASTGSNVTLGTPGTTLDGVTLANATRILLKDQTTASQNGVWVFNGSASALTRPTDFAAASTQLPGTSVFVGQGTANAKGVFTLNVTASITVDTTAETWVQSNGAADLTVTAPLTLTGNQLGLTNPLPIINGGTGAQTATAARTALAAAGKFASSIGDGTTTTFTVTHNLGTTDVTVAVFDMATGNLEIVGATSATTNTVTVGPFSTAPATSSGSLPGGTGKRVVVVG